MMKTVAIIGLLAFVVLAAANDSEESYCKSLLNAKKGYVCHCSEDAVSCFSVYIRRCPKGPEYHDADLKLDCSCHMGFLTCAKPTFEKNL